ncbi:uncharacterized protein LOC131433099 [Malaya genurostris]|uniref:uncharacterized protein LOC131433099 n=1 Tax=Malaya genurostris TaxID=325434 RepID=UPI0026F3A3D3|nr:uncharacterized protein LOC131433099 [Malaya genurostris]
MEQSTESAKEPPKIESIKKPKSYLYDSKNKGLPVYGVIVQWDGKTKYSTKAIMAKFETKLATYRSQKSNENQIKSSLKRKQFPYFRRSGPNKGIVSFTTMDEANAFSITKDPDFYAFIPLSFIVVVGVAELPGTKLNVKDLKPTCPSYEILQWRKKKLPVSKKTQITVAIRGTELPSKIYFKDYEAQLTSFERKPVYCSRCLRYGHRIRDCLRKPRCGICIRTKPRLKHKEQKCHIVKRSGNIERCIYCQQNHAIGSADCVEQMQQCVFKGQLVKRTMDYVSVLESDIIPAIRTTSVNSTGSWLIS